MPQKIKCNIHSIDWNPETINDCPICIIEKKKNEVIVAPARSAYYKGLVAQKVEENSNLKEQRAWLLEQVYFLRKAVDYLESREKTLEDKIKNLETNVKIGIGLIEQLEENEEFTKISAKVEKKNK